jgi:RimJ/RimL family protein N-acetyltransferase
MDDVKLESDRLLLRLPTPRDIDAVYDVARDKRVHQYMILPWPYRRSNAVDFVKMARTQFQKRQGLHLVICGKPELTIMGVIGLQFGRSVDRHCELGYWLGPAYWGQGYITEAVRLAISHAFRELRLNRIWARSLPENKPSTKILQRAGFVIEGQLRRHRKVRTRWHDEIQWGLLRSDYVTVN